MALPFPDAAPDAAPEAGYGGVVFDASGRVLLLRYRSGAWAFPKGHLEAGERPEETAVREVREESGVLARVLRQLPFTSYTNDRGTPRRIGWFLMQRLTGETSLETTFQDGGFYAPAEAKTLLSYPEDRALLDQALAQRQAGGEGTQEDACHPPLPAESGQ